MKPAGATLFFYAAATFLLGVTAFAALTPLAAVEGVSRRGGFGLVDWLRLSAIGVGIVGPVAFAVEATKDSEDGARTIARIAIAAVGIAGAGILLAQLVGH